MGTTTTNLGLYKPAISETGWGANVNANFDTLDTYAASVPATTQSGTTYTLVLSDAGEVVECTSATAVTLTVPPNASVAFPTGTLVMVHQYGAGQVTLAPGAGVTLRSPGAKLKTALQYSVSYTHLRAHET